MSETANGCSTRPLAVSLLSIASKQRHARARYAILSQGPSKTHLLTSISVSVPGRPHPHGSGSRRPQRAKRHSAPRLPVKENIYEQHKLRQNPSNHTHADSYVEQEYEPSSTQGDVVRSNFMHFQALVSPGKGTHEETSMSSQSKAPLDRSIKEETGTIRPSLTEIAQAKQDVSMGFRRGEKIDSNPIKLKEPAEFVDKLVKSEYDNTVRYLAESLHCLYQTLNRFDMIAFDLSLYASEQSDYDSSSEWTSDGEDVSSFGHFECDPHTSEEPRANEDDMWLEACDTTDAVGSSNEPTQSGSSSSYSNTIPTGSAGPRGQKRGIHAVDDRNRDGEENGDEDGDKRSRRDNMPSDPAPTFRRPMQIPCVFDDCTGTDLHISELR